MGRRSTHTAEELRELILSSAREIIERDGLIGLSARTIARKIGYSPGTLYNVFANIDELVLHVEARMLGELDSELRSVAEMRDPRGRLRQIAQTYLSFTKRHPRLWNVLFEHHLPPTFEVPDWYRANLDAVLGVVERSIADLEPEASEGDAKRSARVLWAGVHGITSLATSDKLATVSADAPELLIDDLVSRYLQGLRQSRAVA